MLQRLALAALLAGFATAAAAADAKTDTAPLIWTEQVFQSAARATVEAHLLAVDTGGVTLTTRYGRIHAASLVAPLPYTFGTSSWQQLPNALVLMGTSLPFHHYTPPDPTTYFEAKRDDDQ